MTRVPGSIVALLLRLSKHNNALFIHLGSYSERPLQKCRVSTLTYSFATRLLTMLIQAAL